jgi:peptidoglycan hydrolase-like protein with peptidoglycan-binding domain
LSKTYSLSRDGNKYLSTNFQVKEFKCNDGSDLIVIDDKLIEVLQEVRNHFKKPVHINSAYRTAEYNSKVGGSSTSQHVKGTAADICIDGITPLAIALYINSLDYFKTAGGLGLYSRQKATDGFVHVDVRTSKSRWISKSGTAYLSTNAMMPKLTKGAKDGANRVSYSVTVLQRLLNINADGSFGDGTYQKLIEFQKSKGLTADGICGDKTWAALGG